MRVSFREINLPPFSMFTSDLTVTSHLQTPASLKIVLAMLNLTTSGPLSRSYLGLSITVVPSGAIQVMVA